MSDQYVKLEEERRQKERAEKKKKEKKKRKEKRSGRGKKHDSGPESEEDITPAHMVDIVTEEMPEVSSVLRKKRPSQCKLKMFFPLLETKSTNGTSSFLKHSVMSCLFKTI